ncbi:hypothetical protein HZA42_05155, partial [Candidatus Peregrinibacteria bacterium]|nr:hypothetical protein [Candidatus Peregrinibacteria bacterium]
MSETPIKDRELSLRVRPLSLRAPQRGAKQSSPLAKAVGLVAGAALAVVGAEKTANAQMLVPFGSGVIAVNGIPNPRGGVDAQFVPGIRGNRVRMMFPTVLRNNSSRSVSPDQSSSYNAAEFELRRNANGSLSFVQIGDSVDTIRVGGACRAVDYVHPDGRVTEIRSPVLNPVTGAVIGDLGVDGQNRWEVNTIGCSEPQYIARGTRPNELLVVAAFNAPGLTNGVSRVWRVQITVPDICADIQNRIA